MKILYAMIMKVFLPMFFVTVFFFVFVFELLDVFSNIVRYINRDIGVVDILRIALFYIPKCITYSFPVGLLFSLTFVMGNYYMNNELVAVYSSGVSLYRLIVPFIAFAVISSFFLFFFEEKIAIASFKEKNRLYNAALGFPEPYSESNVAVKSMNDKVIYQANYYNDKNKSLSGVTVLERDEQHNLIRRIDADSAEWKDDKWELRNCRIFEWNRARSMFVERREPIYMDEKLIEKPRVFQKLTRKIDEMEAADAYEWVMSLKRAGRPYHAAMSEYYKKYSFALTPILIALISCSVGGLLKKNVLLMSLFLSICIVVVYYVLQMMTMTFASFGIISPVLGAWSGFFLFLGLGILMLRHSRT